MNEKLLTSKLQRGTYAGVLLTENQLTLILSMSRQQYSKKFYSPPRCIRSNTNMYASSSSQRKHSMVEKI